ncbi:MAG: tetratricopeptide repeat protein [Gammaproteobacteria bacterium]|nr:tetratricopeptide repeat protein [Gammaproteobacteria bacterium]
MSLLLDALKKAEQEKAQKEASKSTAARQSSDSTPDSEEKTAVEQVPQAPAKQPVNFPDNDQNDLSLDDVTEFMGDGVRDQAADTEDTEQLDTPVITDSNPQTDSELAEDLSLDDDVPDDVDLATTAPANTPDNKDAALELEPMEQSLNLDELEVDDDGNVTGPHGVSLDIDQFTSDLTIRKKDALRARPAGTDNYDNSLVKGPQHEVAEPTSSYDTETERAMTPEYARKMFLHKNGSSKFFYYKIYAGITLVLLLVMAVWGLFEVESRFNEIDQGLVSLKRDPMPDAIRPRIDRTSDNLFESSAKQADDKTQTIIARAETFSATDSTAEAVMVNESVREKEPETITDAAEAQDTTDQITEQSSIASTTEPALKDNGQPVKASLQSAQAVQSKPAESIIQLSSKLTVEEKDRLLQQAYAAYEADDIRLAKQSYDQVLELEAQNRDGLLGRAAIHVIDQEYQAAIDKYQLLLEKDPNDSMALTSLISVVNIDPKAGESQIKSLLRQQPDTAYLHFALGNMYGTQQRWSEAQNAYFNALQLESSDPDYAYNLAVSLEHLGKPQAALSYYERALSNGRDVRANFDRQLVRQRIEVLAR